MEFESLTEHLSAYAMTLADGARVLDVGCGQRPYESLFKRGTYVGIEVKVSGGKDFEKIPDEYFDGVNIPFPDESFDGLICTQVLEHCLEPEKLVLEMRRVLKKGANACITVPFMWGEHQTPYDFRRFTSFGIQKLFVDSGFQVISYLKSKTGVAAIEAVVESEIYQEQLDQMQKEQRMTLLGWVQKKIANRLWRLLLFFWYRTYAFQRLHLDNVLIVRRV